VKSGTIFDNIFITDSAAEAEEFANKTWKAHADAEKAAFDKHEAANKPADDHNDDEDEHVHDHDEI